MTFRRPRVPDGLPLAAEALATLVAVKTALRLLPFERWRRLLHRSSRPGRAPASNRDAVAEIVRAVNRATTLFPADLTCLPRALSVQWMLSRRHYASDLHVGVNRDQLGSFEAHAWVEYDGEVIIGGVPDLERYRKLPPWPAR